MGMHVPDMTCDESAVTIVPWVFPCRDALEAEACAATCLSLLCVLADDTEYAPVAEAMGAMGGVRGGAHATGSVSLARVFGPQPGAEGGHGEPPTPSPSRQKGKGRKRGGAAAAEAEGGVRAAARGTREARARVAAAVWGAAGVAMRRGAAGWSQVRCDCHYLGR